MWGNCSPRMVAQEAAPVILQTELVQAPSSKDCCHCAAGLQNLVLDSDSYLHSLPVGFLALKVNELALLTIDLGAFNA